MAWCLGHISRERLDMIVKQGVLQDLNFLDFEACVDCIKGKFLTRARNKRENRFENILDLIHTNIYEPITLAAMGGHISPSYMITPYMDGLISYKKI